MNNENSQTTSKRHKLLSGLGVILCILIIPVLIINVSLLVRSFIDPDTVPSVGGVFPLIVLTDSMYPEIQSGDLIICHTEEAENIKEGDVISFIDPTGNGVSIITHRVIDITENEGQVQWTTKGDSNNAIDAAPVTAENLVGIYSSIRLPGLGNAVMFMQSTPGMIIFVVCPLLLMVAWDAISRKKIEKQKQEDNDALMQELNEFRAKKKAEENA